MGGEKGRFYSPMGKWNWIFLRWLGSSWNWDRILQIDLGHVNYEYCLCYLASCQTLVDELWTYKGTLTEWGMIAVMLLAEIIYYWQRKRSPWIIWQFSKKKKSFSEWKKDGESKQWGWDCNSVCEELSSRNLDNLDYIILIHFFSTQTISFTLFS